MTWTSFLLTLALAYFAYYGLNILFDLMISGKPPGSTTNETTLFFEESSEPELIIEEDPVDTAESKPLISVEVDTSVLSAGPVQAPAAVSLREMLNLAKDDLIEYTRAIPY